MELFLLGNIVYQSIRQPQSDCSTKNSIPFEASRKKFVLFLLYIMLVYLPRYLISAICCCSVLVIDTSCIHISTCYKYVLGQAIHPNFIQKASHISLWLIIKHLPLMVQGFYYSELQGLQPMPCQDRVLNTNPVQVQMGQICSSHLQLAGSPNLKTKQDKSSSQLKQHHHQQQQCFTPSVPLSLLLGICACETILIPEHRGT